MLLGVNILRRGVLFLVDLLLLATGQLTAICGAVRRHLLVDPSLLILQLGRFTRAQLAAFDSLRNTVLLVVTALTHFIVAIVRHVGIVFVAINLIGQMILLSVDLLFFCGSQLSAIRCAIRTRLRINSRFLRFQLGGFSSRQLPALHSICDTILLIFFALSDFCFRRGSRGRLSLDFSQSLWRLSLPEAWVIVLLLKLSGQSG